MKRIVPLLLMACLLMSMSVPALALDIPAATEAGGLSLSAEAVAVGDSVEITLSASAKLATVQAMLTYDPVYLEYVSIAPASGDENFAGLMAVNNDSDNGELLFAYVGEEGQNTLEDIVITLKVIGWVSGGTEIALVTDDSEALVLDALSEDGEIATTYTPKTPSVTLKMYLVGDVDGNGVVAKKDATILARYFAGWEGYEEKIVSMDAADVDRNGTVAKKDATIMARYFAGWEGYEDYFVGG